MPFTALGKPHEIALWGRGNVDEARLADDARRIVETLGGLMGGLPYERYLFIVHLTDKRRGGLEHAASTTLNVGRMQFFPREQYEETLGLFSHEFFHLWNVKRMRPAALVPFDYGREQYTRLLWWFEGATSYYEALALVRAGLLDARKYLRNLGQALTQLERTPGARKMSVEEASFLAWVKHYRPDENSVNSAISYYLKGELVALALDLALRRAGSSLDELLRALYARYDEGAACRRTASSEVARRAPRGRRRAAVLRPARARHRAARRWTSSWWASGSGAGPAQALDDKGGAPAKHGRRAARRRAASASELAHRAEARGGARARG